MLSLLIELIPCDHLAERGQVDVTLMISSYLRFTKSVREVEK